MSINIKSSSGACIERNSVSPLKAGTLIDIKVLHGMLGHASEAVVRKIAKHYGWKLLGTFKKCEDCSLAKAKCKNMSKDSGPRSNIPGDCIFFDISSLQQKRYGDSKFCLLIVDQCTDMSWSYFLKCKSDLATTMIKFIKDLRAKHGKKKATIMRCDNAAENKSFEWLSKK